MVCFLKRREPLHGGGYYQMIPVVPPGSGQRRTLLGQITKRTHFPRLNARQHGILSRQLMIEGESAEDLGADSERRRSQGFMAGEAISRRASSWREPAGQVSLEQVGMGAGAFKNHRTGCQLIDQRPVRLDVTP